MNVCARPGCGQETPGKFCSRVCANTVTAQARRGVRPGTAPAARPVAPDAAPAAPPTEGAPAAPAPAALAPWLPEHQVRRMTGLNALDLSRFAGRGRLQVRVVRFFDREGVLALMRDYQLPKNPVSNAYVERLAGDVDAADGVLYQRGPAEPGAPATEEP